MNAAAKFNYINMVLNSVRDWKNHIENRKFKWNYNGKKIPLKFFP